MRRRPRNLYRKNREMPSPMCPIPRQLEGGSNSRRSKGCYVGRFFGTHIELTFSYLQYSRLATSSGGTDPTKKKAL